MTHVLVVAALQLSHPVPLLVLMETGDALLHHSPNRRAGLLHTPLEPQVAVVGPAVGFLVESGRQGGEEQNRKTSAPAGRLTRRALAPRSRLSRW